MNKVALVLMAGLEMPCRLVHTFIWALDIVARGGEATIILEGESPRWLLLLPDPQHGRHLLYQRVKESGLIVAVCKACATQAQALAATAEEGLPLVYDASGHVSLAPYLEAGYRVLIV